MAEYTARCVHCGRDDAPTRTLGGVRVYERHRRADWRPKVGPGNEVCYAERQPVGEPCRHLVLMATCVGGGNG